MRIEEVTFAGATAAAAAAYLARPEGRALLALEREAFNDAARYAPEEVEARLAEAGARLDVARDAGGPVGFVMSAPDRRDRRSLFVDRIVVAPRARGRGVGRALLAHLLARAREDAFAAVTLTIDPRNPTIPGLEAFYARAGFAVERRAPECVWLRRPFEATPPFRDASASASAAPQVIGARYTTGEGMHTPVNRTRTVAEARILVRADPHQVYTAFRDPVRLKAWYFDDATLDLAPGGRFAFKGIEGHVEAVVTDVRDDGFEFTYEPPWWGTVRIEMGPEAKGTRVRVRHDGFEGREEWVQRFAWGWEAHLRNLKAFLEGRPPK